MLAWIAAPGAAQPKGVCSDLSHIRGYGVWLSYSLRLPHLKFLFVCLFSQRASRAVENRCLTFKASSYCFQLQA